MASLFKLKPGRVSLLDPGAGIGCLSSAFIDRVISEKNHSNIEIDSYEIDSSIKGYLHDNLFDFSSYANTHAIAVKWNIYNVDFIHQSVDNILSNKSLWNHSLKQYSYCIMNPPYKKISSNSQYRRELSALGIETVNLYSAFVALSIELLEESGQLVAIIPRSFCNGPYYKPFRRHILKNTSIDHLHLFNSRNKAFKDDNVLQENIIIALTKQKIQGPVTVSISTDDTFDDIKYEKYSFENIVHRDDPESFIHVPYESNYSKHNISKIMKSSLNELGIQLSTGPVVDFRLKEHLRLNPENGTCPLVYPCHFKDSRLYWPKDDSKKPNAIEINNKTQKWLYTAGYYTVVRRFSSKEEKRRLVASVVEPDIFPNSEVIAFENHLNVFHENKKGIPELIARGLSVFLNSTAVDNYFRRFSGHTQVNATDLKNFKYPNRETLVKLGKWAKKQNRITQELIDIKIDGLINGNYS
nr:Eco57I restriction-modification methylase domain-containing protein [Limihaloglobus sulfuriphilus]